MSLGYRQGAPAAASAPLPFLAGERFGQGPERLSASDLVGRPDLSDAEVIAAIAERLAFEGRTGPEPEVVIEAARLGKRKALAFLRTLVLPAPKARLAMPVQPILRSQVNARHAGLSAAVVSAGG